MTLEAFKQALTAKDWQLAYQKLNTAILTENDEAIKAYLSSNAVEILRAVIVCYAQHTVDLSNSNADQIFEVSNAFNRSDATGAEQFTNEPIVNFIELLIRKGLNFNTAFSESETAMDRLKATSPELAAHLNSLIAGLGAKKVRCVPA